MTCGCVIARKQKCKGKVARKHQQGRKGSLTPPCEVLVDHMGEIGINYVNPATWVVKPLSDALVKINQWRLKAFVLGPQEVSYVAAARCLSNSCGYSCLSDQVQDTWQSLDAQQYKALDVCSEFFGTANCTGDRPWCLTFQEMLLSSVPWNSLLLYPHCCVSCCQGACCLEICSGMLWLNSRTSSKWAAWSRASFAASSSFLALASSSCGIFQRWADAARRGLVVSL